jgi:hypothetical protein
MELLIAIAVVAVGLLLWRELSQWRREAAIHSVVATFGPAQAAAHQDPRVLLVWYPLAEASRKFHPEAFAALDAAMGQRFPFSKDSLERAHAAWTAEWLAWEQAHDEEYRLKAAAAEQEVSRTSGDPASLARARLDRIQHEKIERYQQRYELYVRTAKALQALLS